MFLWTAIIVLTVAVAAVAADGDACVFEENVPMKKDALVKCFETVAWDTSLAEEFFTNLDKYLDMSQFTERLKYPPEEFSYLSMDQKAELAEMKEQAKSKEKYPYEYLVHFDLIKFYNRAHDPHQVYRGPKCFGSFHHYIPFGPVITRGTDATTGNVYSKIVFQEIEEEAVQKLYNTYYENNKDTLGEDLSPENLRKNYVNKVVTLINDKTPYEFYHDLFDYSAQSKEYGSCVNSININQLFIGDSSEGLLDFDSLKVTLEAAEGAEPISISIPVIYTYMYNIKSNAEFGDFCSTGVAPNVSKEAKAAYKALELTKYRNKPDYKKFLRYILKTKYNKTSLKKDDDVEPTCGTDFKEFRKDTIGDLYQLYTITIDNTKYGIFVLTSFAFDVEDQVKNMYNDLVALNNEGIKKLIVDVRGNGGGYVFLSSLVITWLNGKAPGYTQFMWRKRSTDLADMILDLEDVDAHDYYDHRTLHPEDLKKEREYMHFKGKNKDGEEYEWPSAYTSMFAMEPFFEMEDGKLVALDSASYFKPIFNLTREDIYVLGDGVGGSATGMFMWGTKEFMAGRLISVGGYVDSDPSHEMRAGFASFTGASVIDSNDVQDMIKKSGKKDSKFPTALPHGSMVRVTDFSVFGIDHQNELQEFRPSKGEEHIYYWTRPTLTSIPDHHHDYCDTELIKEISRISKTHTFNAAGTSSIWPDALGGDASDCGSDNEDSYVYAHLWNESAGSYTGKCKFAYCKENHYYDYPTKTCVMIPENNESSSSAETVFIVFTIIFVITTIVFGVLWGLSMCKSKKGYSQNNKNPTTLEDSS